MQYIFYNYKIVYLFIYPEPLRTSDPDGYLAKLQKAKQKPIYKEYTLKDYKNLKKDVKLGGLGPDQDTVYERVGIDSVTNAAIYTPNWACWGVAVRL